jgi:Trk K+ transport system NAD-binding subunit
MINSNKVSIVGGAGHVGTPLGLVLSSKGYNVALIDKNQKNIKKNKSRENAFCRRGLPSTIKKNDL